MKAEDIKPIRDSILVYELEAGEQHTTGGMIILDDDVTTKGIHPRWCKVLKVGPDAHDITEGSYILVDHGRWSRGFDASIGEENVIVRWVDYDDVMIIGDSPPYQYNTV